jgi:hypothetical protein
MKELVIQQLSIGNHGLVDFKLDFGKLDLPACKAITPFLAHRGTQDQFYIPITHIFQIVHDGC